MKRFIDLILILNFTVISCTSIQNNKTLDSSDLLKPQQRVEILKHEIISFSDFEDSDFILFNINGFNNTRISIPSASAWDYKFVIKLSKENLDKWLVGMKQIDSLDESWTKLLSEKRPNYWKTLSKPEYYCREDKPVFIIVYRDESLLFKRIIQM